MAGTKRSRSAKSDKRRVPLQHRLPNPPAVFVGREEDLSWLVDALTRATVAVIAGPPGIGKTALALAACADPRLSSRAESSVFVEAPPGPGIQAVLETIRALASVAGTEADLEALQRDPEAAIEYALELAEECSTWIVLDDAARSDDETLDVFIGTFARFARDSRLLVTTRRPPRMRATDGQVRVLGGLPPGSMKELADHWAPNDSKTHEAIAGAERSPGELRRRLFAGADPDEGREALLQNLPTAARDLLGTLARIDTGIGEDTLHQLASPAAVSPLLQLENVGAVLRGPSGVRVHETWRESVEAMATATSLGRAVEVLSSSKRPEDWVRAISVALQAQDRSTARTLLDERLEKVVTSGFAAPLLRALQVGGAEFREARLACAASLGNPTALAQVRRADAQDHSLTWVRTLYLEGRVQTAYERSQSLAETGGESVRAGALHLAARCALQLGEHAQVHVLLEGSEEVEAEVLRALADARSSDASAAAKELTEDRARYFMARCEGAPLQLVADVVELLLDGGRPDLAVFADRLGPSAKAELVEARALLLALARACLIRAEVAQARALADRVRPYVRGASIVRPRLHHVDVERRLLAGELEGLGLLIDTCLHEARGVDAAVVLRLTDARATLDGWFGGEVVEPPGPYSALIAARDGATSQQKVDSVLEPTLAAAVLLANGDTAAAIAQAKDGRERAARRQRHSWAAEATLLEAEACLAGERESEVDTLLAPLRVPGWGAHRLSGEADGIAAIAGTIHMGELERRAARMYEAPVAARRCRALLGGEVALDEIDLRVLESAAVRVGTVTPLEPMSAWAPGWGIDRVETSVWLSDGQTLDMRKRAVAWRVLTTILDAGGAATKEQLVLGVWEEREYHPGRHDTRLHVTMRKLRKIIEARPDDPERLLTLEDGYRLGGRVRVRT